jgi:hypothetical protein
MAQIGWPGYAGHAQPTIRRDKQSSTTATYSQPSPVRYWVMSATHNRFGAAWG